MNKKTKLVLAALGFAVFMAAGSLIYSAISPGDLPGIPATREKSAFAPDFTVKDPEGRDVKLSDLRGKPVVINFWASWCPPCRDEMPHFQKMFEELDSEVSFMMIDLPGGGETQKVAEKFLAGEGFTFPVYYDTTGEASLKYGVNAIPTSVFVNAEGLMTGKVTGALKMNALRGGIESAMK